MQAANSSWVLVYKAQSLIERDSLMAELAAAGIEAETEKKDMHNRLTATQVDLAYDGLVSISFEGFPIKVSDRDAARAEAVIQAAMQKFNTQEESIEETPGEKHVRKYAQAGLFTMFVPILMHGIAIYHLIKAIQLGANVFTLKTLMATVIMLLMAGVLVTVGLMTFWPGFMRF